MTRITDQHTLLQYLDTHGIAYTRSEHPPVYTCEEAAQFRPPAPGLDTKNLFLRDENHRFLLVMTACEKRLNLKALGAALGVKKLHFASEEQLMDHLGLTPGAVTVLALVNDPESRVDLVVDAQYYPAETYLCHPLVNTATLALGHAALEKFFECTGHVPKVVAIPGM